MIVVLSRRYASMRFRELYLILTSCAIYRTGAYFRFILDFVEYHGDNVKVTLYDCNKNDLRETAKSLSVQGHPNRMLTTSMRRMENPVPSYQHFLVVQTSCSGVLPLLKKVNEAFLFAPPFHWVLLTTKENGENFVSSLRNFSFLVDTDINIGEKVTEGHVTVKKLFKKHASDTELLEEPYGQWDERSKFRENIGFEVITWKRRRSLGVRLRACLVITNPQSLNHLTDTRDKHIDSLSKVCYPLLKNLISIYNISLSIQVQRTWGYKDNQSNWSGMMGLLTRRETDISGTSLFMTRERVSIIDYIATVSPTRSKFVFRQPKLSYVSNIFTLPFDSKVWMCSGLLIVIVTVVLYVLIKWEWRKKTFVKIEDDVCTEPELTDSFMEVVFVIFAALCQQGASVIPYSSPGRIATIFLFIAVMFLYVSYSANIVALLQMSSSSIRTLEDLLNSRLLIGVDDLVYNRFYFSTAEEPIRKSIYERKVAPPGKPSSYMSMTEGVRRMKEGLFAFHMETGSGYKLVSEIFTENEKCDLQELSYIQVVDPYFAVSKNLSYREMFKVGFHLLRENGMQRRENNRIYTKKPICTSMAGSFISVGIIDCYFAAVILLGGIAASMVMFFLEILMHKYNLFGGGF
ncbi:hypothetical protein GWI33_014400 [Rhynchophorus ferrugineus]|uniref:Uncharacterized protein n=1 Tax=Rhynchophorus ferrugineus TaxID=354439 RepID=A0A834M937_RHYFE|nr:hypothetical protein GWI33_014400 [Rhynchophorus ferrugineus]